MAIPSNRMKISKQNEKKLREELNNTKFAEQNNLTLFKKLFIFLSLLLVKENLAAKESKSINLSQIEKIKLMTLDYIKKNKFTEAEYLYEQSDEALNKQYDPFIPNLKEHAMKLQESYKILKMEPRLLDESDDKFQDRLFNHTAKTVTSVVGSGEENVWLYIKDAYMCLSKYVCHGVNPSYIPSGNLETERASMRLAK